MHETVLISMWHAHGCMRCRIEIKLVTASTGYIFTVFIAMSGWFLLASTIAQYQRKIKLLNQIKIKLKLN